MIWECDIMNGMRMWYYEWYENVILWMVWECYIMNGMRMLYYEWYENVKLWKIWEYIVMKDIYIYILYKTQTNIY